MAFDNSQVTHSVVGDGGTRVMVGPMSLRPGTQRFEPVGGDADECPTTCCGCFFSICCICCNGTCFKIEDQALVLMCPRCLRATSRRGGRINPCTCSQYGTISHAFLNPVICIRVLDAD